MDAGATTQAAVGGAATDDDAAADDAAAPAVAATAFSTGPAATGAAGIGEGGKLNPVEAGEAAAAVGEATTALAPIRARRLDVAGVTNIDAAADDDTAAAAAAGAGLVKQETDPAAPAGVSGMTHRSRSRKAERGANVGVSGMSSERSRPGVHGVAAAVAVAAMADAAAAAAAEDGTAAARAGVAGSTAGVSGTMTATPPLPGDKDGGVGGMCNSPSAGEQCAPGVCCGVVCACECDWPNEPAGVEWIEITSGEGGMGATHSL